MVFRRNYICCSSSARWAMSQAHDPFVADARRQGYLCRSAFKLTHIDDKFGLLSPSQQQQTQQPTQPTLSSNNAVTAAAPMFLRPQQTAEFSAMLMFTDGDVALHHKRYCGDRTKGGRVSCGCARTVIDLGASPGSWCQVIRERVG